VKTLLEKLFFKPFPIHCFTSIHHPNNLPNIPVRE
jgi:hypothetical protein